MTDCRILQKRFQRIESHIVTLARSVAHLSQELSSNQLMCSEVEHLKSELDNIKQRVSKQRTVAA